MINLSKQRVDWGFLGSIFLHDLEEEYREGLVITRQRERGCKGKYLKG
jgi:hypothetical protein